MGTNRNKWEAVGVVEAALTARKAAITRLRAQPLARIAEDTVGYAGLAAMDGLDGAAMARVRAMRALRIASGQRADIRSDQTRALPAAFKSRWLV